MVARTIKVTEVYAKYEIGRYIVEDEQGGEERAAYGKALLKELSQMLTSNYGNGWSVETLTACRKFFNVYSKIVNSVYEIEATMWNAGLMASSIDDSGFLMALLDALAEQYPINLDSVFFTGFSMGGFMTHRMAIEHGDRITACAPVSGLITHSMANQTAVAPVRILHIHGTADPVVGYDGNSQYFGGNLGLSVDAILDYWKNANHCVDEPVIDTFPDLKNDGLRFVRYTYEGDAELQHIKVIGGNHTWYMSESQYDIGYMTEIHKFFVGNGGGGEGIAESEEYHLDLWPNPTSDCFSIKVESTTNLEVMDLQGRSVAKYNLTPGTHQIDLGDLPEGLYFIKGENGKVQKLLLTK